MQHTLGKFEKYKISSYVLFILSKMEDIRQIDYDHTIGYMGAFNSERAKAVKFMRQIASDNEQTYEKIMEFNIKRMLYSIKLKKKYDKYVFLFGDQPKNNDMLNKICENAPYNCSVNWKEFKLEEDETAVPNWTLKEEF